MRSGKNFWNKEYQSSKNLAISNNPSEDLIHFTKWLKKNDSFGGLNSSSKVLDLGCGNGRNLIYLAKTFGVMGTGYDISIDATNQAKKLSYGLNLKYETRSIAGRLDLPSTSQNLVLDMMTSHFLNEHERINLMKEIYRVLQPGGWLYFKTFLKDEDINARKLLRERPAEEKGSYIHPKIGVAEHVFTEEEIRDLLKNNFKVHKMLRSHRHIKHGHAGKRRSISVYAEKI